MTHLPDLSRLTESQKDALILALWQQVRDLSARVAELEAALSLVQLIEELTPYLIGWRGYFGTAEDAGQFLCAAVAGAQGQQARPQRAGREEAGQGAWPRRPRVAP